MTIQIDTADDMYNVFANWHDTHLEVLDQLIDMAQSEVERKAYENVLSVIRDMPVQNEYFLDEFVANRSIELTIADANLPEFLH